MKFLVVLVALIGLATPSLARTIEQQILEKLAAQGYVILEQGYTFLGRLRIVAENDRFRREIVVNPGTGEILRDYAVTLPHRHEDPDHVPVPFAAASNPQPDEFSSPGVTASAGVVEEADETPPDATSDIVEDSAIPFATPDVFQSSEEAFRWETGPIELVLPESILQMDPGSP